MALEKSKELAAAMAPALSLPTKDELLGIVDKGQKKPADNKVTFPGTPSSIFWSIRAESKDNLATWLIDFKTGRVLGHTHKAKYLARLVRAA